MTEYAPLHSPDHMPSPPASLDAEIRLSREALDDTATANLHDHDEIMSCAVVLNIRMRALLDALDARRGGPVKLSRRAAARRHRQLMAAAERIVSRSILYSQVDTAAPADVAALVFGRHGLRIEHDEALDYLNAVLAERGYALRRTGTTAPEAGA
ncbi:hypothetical protein ABZX85_41690 [Streptomyces sp. NPDC004539]|uniref:hypothetical protein n=1 Tax=Streptomyces sp. NPDC004539 TaxID=3154280 RepID=UPI0033B541FC